MITENLSALKIHKLSKTQYDREREAGNLDETALYLTPDEELEHFSGDYNDLVNAPNIEENDEGSMVVADESGNIVLKVDVDGIHTPILKAETLIIDSVDIGAKLCSKADKATTLEGYGITDAASKKYVDTIIEGLTTEGTADAALVQATLKAHTDDKNNPHGVDLSQLGVVSTVAELNYVSGATSNIQNQLNNKAAYNHTHSASNINSGTLPLNRGGTGTSVDLNNAPANAIIRKLSTDKYNQLYYTATKNGAFYATEENGVPKFGVLPIAQGGIGSSSGATGLKNLFAAGATVITEGQNYQYGTSLPAAGNKGRIFFKKVNS